MPGKDPFDLLSAFAQSQSYGPKALEYAQSSDREAFRLFCDQHKECDHFKEDMLYVMEGVLKAPESFSYLRDVWEQIEKSGMPFDEAFATFEADGLDVTSAIWMMYGKTPGKDALYVASALAAEAIGFQLMRDPNWTLDAKILSDIADGAGRENILKIQHALVDYVQGEGKDLPMNRAAPKLYSFAHDFDPAMQQLWSKKLQGFHVSSRYSILKGDITSADYDFGAP